MDSMSHTEALAALATARETVIDEFKKALLASGIEGSRDLASPATLKWSLEGIKDPVAVETNLLGMLFIEFYSVNNLDWTIGDAEILEDVRKAECVMVGQELDWIGDHFSVMAKNFGAMKPEVAPDSLHFLTIEMMNYFVKALYFTINKDIRKHVMAEIAAEFSEVAQDIAEGTVLPAILSGTAQ